MAKLREPARKFTGSVTSLWASSRRGESGHQNSVRPVAIGEARDEGALKQVEKGGKRIKGANREYPAKC